MKLTEFKAFVLDLIGSIVASADRQNEQLKKTVDDLNAKIKDLEGRLSGADQGYAADILALSEELKNKFNPTPATDALIGEVIVRPDLPTPPELANGQPPVTEITPPQAGDAALAAVGDAIEAAATE
jgi:hypothetical protein